MSIIRIVTSIAGGILIGMLFSKKSGEEISKEMEGKKATEKAKIIGSEILDIFKNLGDGLKNLSEEEKVKKFTSLGKEKLEELKNFLVGKSAEFKPYIEEALKNIGSSKKTEETPAENKETKDKKAKEEK